MCVELRRHARASTNCSACDLDRGAAWGVSMRVTSSACMQWRQAPHSNPRARRCQAVSHSHLTWFLPVPDSLHAETRPRKGASSQPTPEPAHQSADGTVLHLSQRAPPLQKRERLYCVLHPSMCGLGHGAPTRPSGAPRLCVSASAQAARPSRRSVQSSGAVVTSASYRTRRPSASVAVRASASSATSRQPSP